MKKIFFLHYFLIVILLLAGCTGIEGDSSDKSSNESNDTNKVVKIGWQDSGYISPFTFTNLGPGGFLRNSFIMDSLTWKDDSSIIPWLASSWEVSDDNTEYIFTLEDNVTFHDGEPLTADDVVFTYGYFKEHTVQWSVDMSKIDSTNKISENKVKITLTEPYIPFITEIAGVLPIIPEHIWSKIESPMEYQESDALIGTGPFTLENYDSAAGNYRFIKNDNYFKGEVMVEEVQYLAVENRILSLQNKEIDGGMTFNYAEVEELENKGFDTLKSEPTGSAVRIVFNLNHDKLSDKKLRQAIAYALDRETIAEKLTNTSNVMVGSAGVIPPDSPWYNDEVKQYDYNIKKSNEMLDNLGYDKNEKGIREGLDLSVTVSSTSQEAVLIKSMLKDVGIDLTINELDAATFSNLMAEGKFDLTITGHIGFSGDPDFFRLLLTGQGSNSYAGKEVFENEEFTKLANRQLAQSNQEERKRTVDEMQDVIAEELPTIILYHRPFYFMYDAKTYDSWFNTYSGIADGIPLTDNKAVFVDYK